MTSWTSRETRSATRLEAKGVSPEDIVLAIGGRHTVAELAARLRLTARVRIKRRPSYQELRATTAAVRAVLPIDRTSADQKAVADRERRMILIPRDLTAAFCGDPLPGYSAADRKI